MSSLQLPRIGVGTFGSDKYSAREVALGVEMALEIGYRNIDCAAVYGNEREVGAAIRRSLISRETLWVTSKVWNNRHDDVVGACEQSLRDLGLDYLDLYLIHWPFPHHHAQGVDVGSRDPHARPFDHDRYMRTWNQMERLVDRGLVRRIGTSNMTTSKLRGLLADADVLPFANELELHPHFQQPDLVHFLKSREIVPIGYCPLGSPSRPDRDRAPDDTVDLEDPVIRAIADHHQLHPAVVCIKWQLQLGTVPIPFSVKRDQLESTYAGSLSAPLSDDEMAAISKIDRGCRLIKGQVFLWEEAPDWTALWD